MRSQRFVWQMHHINNAQSHSAPSRMNARLTHSSHSNPNYQRCAISFFQPTSKLQRKKLLPLTSPVSKQHMSALTHPHPTPLRCQWLRLGCLKAFQLGTPQIQLKKQSLEETIEKKSFFFFFCSVQKQEWQHKGGLFYFYFFLNWGWFCANDCHLPLPARKLCSLKCDSKKCSDSHHHCYRI